MGFRAADPINQTNAAKRLFLENHKIQHPGHFLGISVVLSSCSEELRPTKRNLEPGSRLAQIAPFPLVSAELLWHLSAETPAVALTQFSVSPVLFPPRKWSLGVVLQRCSRNYNQLQLFSMTKVLDGTRRSVEFNSKLLGETSRKTQNAQEKPPSSEQWWWQFLSQ